LTTAALNISFQFFYIQKQDEEMDQAKRTHQKILEAIQVRSIFVYSLKKEKNALNIITILLSVDPIKTEQKNIIWMDLKNWTTAPIGRSHELPITFLEHLIELRLKQDFLLVSALFACTHKLALNTGLNKGSYWSIPRLA
jgi:hypothetical protein